MQKKYCIFNFHIYLFWSVFVKYSALTCSQSTFMYKYYLSFWALLSISHVTPTQQTDFKTSIPLRLLKIKYRACFVMSKTTTGDTGDDDYQWSIPIYVDKLSSSQHGHNKRLPYVSLLLSWPAPRIFSNLSDGHQYVVLFFVPCKK